MFRKMFLVLAVLVASCSGVFAQAYDDNIYVSNISTKSQTVSTSVLFGQSGGYFYNASTWSVPVEIRNSGTRKWFRVLTSQSGVACDLTGGFTAMQVIVSTQPYDYSATTGFNTDIADKVMGIIRVAR